MKVFVSGQIEEKQSVRAVLLELEEAGFVITHDWTRTDDLLDRVAQADEASRRAVHDITGVVKADIYILLSNNIKPGKGMYVELGAALALREVRGAPDIYVVGPQNHQSIFYLHPYVKNIPTVEQLLECLKAKRSAAANPEGQLELS